MPRRLRKTRRNGSSKARRTRKTRRNVSSKSRRGRRVQSGGFTPYPTQTFGADITDIADGEEGAGSAVIIRNVSGVPTAMSAALYKKEYRGEYDEGV